MTDPPFFRSKSLFRPFFLRAIEINNTSTLLLLLQSSDGFSA
jgi:hypothetical protein